MKKWLMWKWFGRPLIALQDSDGEITYRYAFKFDNPFEGVQWTAHRFQYINVTVALLPNGLVDGPSYVRKWAPVYPKDFTV